jgi:hypothetical protein
MNPPEMTDPETSEAVEVLTPGPPEASVMTPLDRPYRLTVKRYSEMANTGVFRKEDRLYLWKGRLVEKMTKGRPHVVAVNNLIFRLGRLVPDGYHVQVEQPIALGDDSAPEPDLTIIRGIPSEFGALPPVARQVVLLIEVADSSLAEDLGDVLQTYAAEGIPIYWVVNIPAHRIEVYTEPTGPIERPYYRALRIYGPNDKAPVVIDGHELGKISMRDILP